MATHHAIAHHTHHRSRRAADTRHDILMLVAMCVFAFLALGLFAGLKAMPDNGFAWSKFFPMMSEAKPAEEHFTLGRVKLGTTMDAVRAHHANAVKGVTSDGSITLAFLDKGDQYVVFYGEDGPFHVAYKARQSRELTGVSEDEFVGNIVKRYGAPSLSTCSRRLAGGFRDCQFSWWIPGELRLDVNSRQEMGANADAAKLKVTVQLTDTRLDSRIHSAARAASQVKAR